MRLARRKIDAYGVFNYLKKVLISTKMLNAVKAIYETVKSFIKYNNDFF